MPNVIHKLCVIMLFCIRYTIEHTQTLRNGSDGTPGPRYVLKLTLSFRTFARKFSNVDFFLRILPLRDDELVMSEM